MRERESQTYNNASDIAGLKSWDGQLERLQHAVVDSLANETIKINWTSQQLNMALPEESDVTVGRGSVDERAQGLTLLAEPNRFYNLISARIFSFQSQNLYTRLK